ncbi:hypothetical protein EPO34_02045 [Patescibacteria group bacterium]|nr:MAG: hypothetical protein EPO34_02045 [Patescibacteria group bacterium]
MRAIILCGGGGVRLWPLSRTAKPKQFAALLTEESLLRDTYRRLLRSIPSEKIYACVAPEVAELVAMELPELVGRILVEPERRDTGPAMRFAAAALMDVAPDEPLVFVPSDHFIGDDEAFLRCLSAGELIVKQRGTFADIGIAPTFPSTGLGYTRIGTMVACDGAVDAFEFLGHAEKPDYETAKSYLEDGSYLWHANYYMATPRMFVEACDRYAPEILSGARASFDRVVTERMPASAMTVIQGTFPWSDVGSWDALHAQLAEEGANVERGDSVLVDTRGSLVYAYGNKPVAVLGLDDVVVVDTPEALLVCKKSDAQRVKEVVEKLKGRYPHVV